jgi:ribosome-associated protein YbcJ (S4-like RNA binding protein)
LQATGKLENMYAFLFDDKKLKGNFNVSSNHFEVSDFLVNEKQDQSNSNKSTTDQSGSLTIPDFLDINTQISIKKVIYDNIILENVSGAMKLKNQIATITNTKAQMLDGNVVVNGNVDTKKSPAVFDLDLIVKNFDIANSFATLETFKKIVPVAKMFSGKYNTAFKIKGNLNDDFQPEMNSISGTVLADLLVDNINSKGSPLLETLTSSFNFIDFKKLNVKNLKTALTFENGRVAVKPFDLTYKDIKIRVTGNHGFDKSLKYNMLLDLPAKYLGNEAASMLSKLTNVDKDTVRIPLLAIINGSALQPKVNANFKQALTALAVKVAKYKKNELLNQANEQVNEVVNDVISDIGLDSILPQSLDTILPKPRDIINGTANDILDGIFGKKKKKKKKDD